MRGYFCIWNCLVRRVLWATGVLGRSGHSFPLFPIVLPAISILELQIHFLHRHGVLGLGACGLGDNVGFETVLHERGGKRFEFGSEGRILERQMSDLPLCAVLDLGKMHMEVFHPLIADRAEQDLEAVAVVPFRPQTALFPCVDMSKIDTWGQNFVDLADLGDLFHGADLRDFPHRLGAEHHVVEAVETDVVAEGLDPVEGAGEGDGAGVLPLCGGVKDDAASPHFPADLCAVEDIAVRFCRHFVVGVGKIDEIGRMDGDLDALSIECFPNGMRLLLGHLDPSAEGIFEAVESVLPDEAGGIFRVLESRGIEALAVAARSEFYHDGTPLVNEIKNWAICVTPPV